jgi:outer membrane receptor protein involved in Fe transport
MMETIMKKYFALGATVTLLSTFSYAENSVNENFDNSEELSVVIIKGQKIERSLHETVESVAVYSSIDLEAGSSTSDLFNLMDQTANFTRNGSFDYSIRGIKSNGPAGSSDTSRTISVVTDGATQTSRASRAGIVSTWDMEQIEVLRGPQSTNQGRNALAGAIILKSKDPEFQTNGHAKVTAAEYGETQVAFAHTAPLNDNLSFRIAVDRHYKDGYLYSDFFKDNEWNATTTETIRGKLLYLADNGSEWLFTASDVTYDEEGDDNVFYTSSDRLAYDNYRSIRETNVNNYVLEINQDLNDAWSVTSVTSLSRATFFRDTDGDIFSTFTGTATTGQDIDEKIFAQDIRFNFESEIMKTVLGIYFAKGKADMTVVADNLDFSTEFGGLLGTTLPFGTAVLNTNGNNVEKFENYALYFNADINLTDQLTLITGLRADFEERSNDSDNVVEHSAYGFGYGGLLGEPPAFNPLGGGTWGMALDSFNGAAKDEEDFFIFLPKLGVRFDLSDEMNIAATFQTGYRSGGVSTNLATGTTKAYDEETTNNYEVSFRSEWLDNALTFNANAFYIEWKDMQVEMSLSPSNPYDTETVNAGKSHLWGGELESRLQATDELSFNASVGYVETKFDKFDGFKGNEFSGAPDVTANIGSTFRSKDGLFLNGNVSHVGNAFTNATNKFESDAYTVVNTKIGYEKSLWSAYLFANNLFDRDYNLSEFSTAIASDPGSYEVGAPRVVGVTGELYW